MTAHKNRVITAEIRVLNAMPSREGVSVHVEPMGGEQHGQYRIQVREAGIGVLTAFGSTIEEAASQAVAMIRKASKGGGR